MPPSKQENEELKSSSFLFLCHLLPSQQQNEELKSSSFSFLCHPLPNHQRNEELEAPSSRFFVTRRQATNGTRSSKLLVLVCSSPAAKPAAERGAFKLLVLISLSPAAKVTMVGFTTCFASTTSLASKREPEVVLLRFFNVFASTTSLTSKCELEVVLFSVFRRVGHTTSLASNREPEVVLFSVFHCVGHHHLPRIQMQAGGGFFRQVCHHHLPGFLSVLPPPPGIRIRANRRTRRPAAKPTAERGAQSSSFVTRHRASSRTRSSKR